nr:MAG TPA: hypothetical protein [Caudoviricetes sp.]
MLIIVTNKKGFSRGATPKNPKVIVYHPFIIREKERIHKYEYEN